DNRFENDDFSKYFTEAIRNLPYAFDNAGSEAVVNGTVNLNNYFGIIWFCGRDSYAPTNGTGTLNGSEQSFISSYLEGGGRIFFSGAEIGYDLDYKGTNPAFYNNYLKADYIQDDSGNYHLTGSNIFAGMDFYFDDDDYIPDGGAYEPRWPDVITTISGSSVCLAYGTGTTAGVQYQGIFGAGTETGKIVTFGFPFETITSSSQRQEVLRRILIWFDDIPPETSELKFSVNDGTGNITLSWTPSANEDLSEIDVEVSTDGISFSSYSILPSTPVAGQITGLAINNDYYLRIRSRDLSGNSSNYTGVLAVGLSGTEIPDLLIVEDENRYAPNDYIVSYGLAVFNDLHYFDSASSEAVVSEEINLNDYDKVIWFCGRDSFYPDYGTGSFNSAEAQLVKPYLESGGKFFVSGAEIGYDLEYKGSNTDLYQNYFKSDYLYDDGISYTVNGITNEIFNGFSFDLYTDDSGSVQGVAPYQARWPDSIQGINGGITILAYSSGRNGASRWAGFSPNGTNQSRIIMFGFPFECINSRASQNSVLQNILKDFRRPEGVYPEIWGPTQVKIFWNENPEENLSGYHVYRSILPDSGFTDVTGLVTENETVITSLSSGVTYFFKLTSENTNNIESFFSSTVHVCPKELEVTKAFSPEQETAIVQTNYKINPLILGNPGDYSINPAETITAVSLLTDERSICLTIPGLDPGVNYTLTVPVNIQSKDGTNIASDKRTASFLSPYGTGINIRIDNVSELSDAAPGQGKYILFPDWGVDVSDQKVAFISDRTGVPGIYTISPYETGTLTAVTEGDTIVYFSKISWGWNGGGELDYIYYCEQNQLGYSQIYRIKEDGTAREHLSIAASGFYINWFDPDYTKFPGLIDGNGNGDDRVVCSVNGDLYVFDPDDLPGSLIRLTSLCSGAFDTTSDRCLQPRWWESDGSYSGTPGELKIVFVRESRTTAQSEIYVLNRVQELIQANMPSGSGTTVSSWDDSYYLTKITDNSLHDWSPSWSNDGSVILFPQDINNSFLNEQFNSNGVLTSLTASNFNIYLTHWDDPCISGDESDVNYSLQPLAENPYNEAFTVWAPYGGDRLTYVSKSSDDYFKLNILPITSISQTDSSGQILYDFGYTEVAVSQDDFSGNLQLSVAPPLDPPANPDSNGRKIDAGEVREFFADGGGISFENPVKLIINYNDVDQNGYIDGTGSPGIPELEAKIWFWNEEQNQWELIGGIIDTIKNTITIYTDHFSIYGIFHSAKIRRLSDFSETRIYPNPFRPNDNNPNTGTVSGGIIIEQLPDNIKSCKIYNIAGNLVNEIPNKNLIYYPDPLLAPDPYNLGGYSKGGVVIWNGKNSFGKRVASGIYLILIETESGIKKLIKIGIIY
ncbi:MAG: fibronectin type III domain-containing protein, partial [bacterium]|nr:fibronectin type III domain-containing protein [bacterium]